MEKINLKLAEVVSLAIELNGNPQNPESEYKGILNEKMSLTTRYWLNQINKEVSEEKVIVDKLVLYLFKLRMMQILLAQNRHYNALLY